VADHMQFSNDTLQWNIIYIRSMHDWEVEVVSSFFNLWYSLELQRGGEDKICWIPSKRQTLEVKSVNHVLSPPTSPPFLGRAFGEIGLPREWRALFGRQH
jgi:hypothetical protein